MIDRTFRNINRLFALSFKNDENDLRRGSYDRYYMSLVEIKDFNALLDNEPFFDQPVKNKQGAYEKLPTMIFIAEKQQKTIPKFSLDSLNVIE